MRTRVQRWGNSLAVRIPSAFAQEAEVDQHSEVDLSLVDGSIVLKPLKSPVPTLEELLARVTDESLHAEVETGEAVGREVW